MISHCVPYLLYAHCKRNTPSCLALGAIVWPLDAFFVIEMNKNESTICIIRSIGYFDFRLIQFFLSSPSNKIIRITNNGKQN